ncbi:hypothetical protein CH63R_10775 [Colletotrichum higginsianum IMI 349063]|uniref:Uncharacterized protein n=1 Tax=Colletotrichum higginsianum (strain IMI 349063) TaxID=759273 RepID=A0A1B7Y3W1_COLHI|nr:uncharacterized protein CH63R_10775 [Colletotrichum higginsianum IMI 349063]OBR06655.1 hypothetical protein CH63R_10775 [Colletotrichum higginsianum IMI 349063]
MYNRRCAQDASPESVSTFTYYLPTGAAPVEDMDGKVPGRSMIDDEHCRSRDLSLMQPPCPPSLHARTYAVSG